MYSTDRSFIVSDMKLVPRATIIAVCILQAVVIHNLTDGPASSHCSTGRRVLSPLLRRLIPVNNLDLMKN